MKKVLLIVLTVGLFSINVFAQPSTDNKVETDISFALVPGEKAVTEIVKDKKTGKLLAAQTYTEEQLQLALGQVETKYQSDKKNIMDLISKISEDRAPAKK